MTNTSCQTPMPEAVYHALVRILKEQANDPNADIGMDTSLTADLGLDSVSFITVAVAIENALGIAELPLAAWSDQESEREGLRFTVGSLVALCLAQSTLPRPNAALNSALNAASNEGGGLSHLS